MSSKRQIQRLKSIKRKLIEISYDSIGCDISSDIQNMSIRIQDYIDKEIEKLENK